MAVPGVETSDETLAARAAAGDEPAFEALVIRYQARVFRLARRLTGNDGDAQDSLQDAFLQVHRHLPSFRGESRFSTWLYRIATNAALMLRRSRGRRPAESLEEFLPRFDAEGRHAASPAELRSVCNAEEVIDRQLLAEKARAGIDRLPDLYREAFILRDLGGHAASGPGGIAAPLPALASLTRRRARIS